MAEEVKKGWRYENLDEETGKVKYTPNNDLDGKITGKFIYGLKAWFDENPTERIRLGWTKHIYCENPGKAISYNHQTQYLVKTTRQVDAWTVEDEYHIMNKSEEMMRLEELTNHGNGGWYDDDDSVIFWG